VLARCDGRGALVRQVGQALQQGAHIRVAVILHAGSADGPADGVDHDETNAGMGCEERLQRVQIRKRERLSFPLPRTNVIEDVHSIHVRDGGQQAGIDGLRVTVLATDQ
jgi:hypothetical protein